MSNHLIRRPLRTWSVDGGPDTADLDALQHGDADRLREAAPAPADERGQHADELAVSLAHLRRVEDGYWGRDWRREHRGSGLYPENHLWDAVQGYLDLLDAGRRLPAGDG